MAVTSTAEALPANGRVVIRADAIGVRYSLRLTRKQTVRDSLVKRMKRTGDPDFWALRDVVVQRSSMASRSA